MSKVVEKAKNKKWVWIAGLIIVIGFIYGMGNSSAKVELEDGKVNINELNEKITSTEKELKELESKLEEAKGLLQEEEDKLSERQSEVEEVFSLIDDRDSLASDISSKESELESLNSEIETKQKELDTLDGKILEAKGKPITINAGQYFVGTDIPPGRYQASGSSNFVVYDENGSLMVNTILGDGLVGDGDYVFFALDGYFIETSSKTTLTPVE